MMYAWHGQVLRRRLQGSIGRAIVRATGKTDSADTHDPASDVRTLRWRGYLSGVLIAAGCTALAAVMSIWFAPTNLAMVYLLGVVLAATQLGRNAAVATSVIGTLSLDFFFIPPIYSFAIRTPNI